MLLTEQPHVNPRTLFRVRKANRVVRGEFRDEYDHVDGSLRAAPVDNVLRHADAHVEGCEAKLTMYPGAIEAFDRPSPPILALPSPTLPRRTRSWSAGAQWQHARLWR